MNEPLRTYSEIAVPAWVSWALQGVLFSSLVLLVLETNRPAAGQMTARFIEEIAVIGALFLLSVVLAVRSFTAGSIPAN